MNPADFLAGKLDYLFKPFGTNFKGSTNKYSPINRKGLNWHTYEEIFNTDEGVATLGNLWQTLGTKYELKVRCNLFRSEKKNTEYKEELEKMLRNEKQFIKNIIWHLAVKGNVMLTINEYNQIIPQHIDFYDIYWDWVNNDYYRIDFKVDGAVKIKGLENKKEVYHIKNPFASVLPLGTPPIDLFYEKVMTNSNLWQFINQEAASGLTGLNMLSLDLEKLNIDWEGIDNQTGKTGGQTFVDKVKDWFSKTREDKRERLAVVPHLNNVFKLTSSIKDQEVLNVLEEIKNTYAKAFNVGTQAIGDGDTTYSNVEAMIDNEWSRAGKTLQETICIAYNEWILPAKGIETNKDLEVYVEKPQDEDQNEKEKSIISLIGTARDILSTEEKRQIIKDTFGFDLADSFEPETLPEPEQPEENQPNFVKFAKKKDRNILEDAFKSPFYERTERVKGKPEKKGLKPLIEKSIKRQLERTITNFKENDSLDLDKHFVKIESVLPFTVLKDNLLNFVDLARQEVADRMKELGRDPKFSAKFALSDVLDRFLNALVKFNLQGYDSLTKAEKDLLGDFDGDYKGFDEETINQINTVLQEFKDEPLDQIIEALTTLIDNMPENRAKLIADMLVSNAVEKSRYLEYKDKEAKFKRHLGVRDSRETEFSTEATAEGVVPIDFVYNHQIGDGQAPPLHFGERSSMVYGWVKEDLI